jgi:DNA-binding protein H-NS
MASLKELLAQKQSIEREIELARKREQSDAIAKVRALMAEHGLTMADLSARPAPVKGKAKAGSGKVAAKYRNTATGETWSGRGLQPRWLKAALASGKKIGDFAV